MEDNERPESFGKAGSKAKPEHLWKKGQSGNPRGYRRGSKHRATLFAESLLKGQCEGLVKKTIELGLAGDVGALRLCLERLLPPLKSRPIQFKLPALRTVSDALSAMTLIIDGAASGQIFADEAQVLSDMVGNFMRALQINDLEERLAVHGGIYWTVAARQLPPQGTG
jgi:hypothetical protein